MRFDVLTLFPQMFEGPLQTSILGRAQNSQAVEVHIHDIRDSAVDNHKTVDDTPYGGGAGMVLKVDIIDTALQKIIQTPEIQVIPTTKRRIILLTPQGKRFQQPLAQYIAEEYKQVTLICGHYEGFDERIRDLVDSQLSLGDFVLTGGELPALIVIDAVTRLLPSVLHEQSPEEESFNLFDEKGNPLVEYPHYTRPLEYNGQKVPDVLLSGHHAEIQKWRIQQAINRTEEMKEDNDPTI